jgi:hypothetical protein
MATASAPLIDELDGYRKQFEQSKETFSGLVNGLTDDDFNWRPVDDRWSMAECIDHLIMVGTLMNRNIDEGIEKGHANGWHSEGPFKYGWLGNKFVEAAGASPKARKRKFKAPRIYTPTSNHSISRLHDAFYELQDAFLVRIERANGLDLARIKVPSPVTSLLKLSLGQWFKLLATHQERHLIQADEVRSQLKPSGH